VKNFIFIKKNAVSKQKCENIIDILNISKLNPASSEMIKNFYDGMSVDVYKSEWKEDLFNCILEYKNQHKFLDSIYHCEWKVQAGCNYQKYKPRQTYSLEHCEQGGQDHDKRRMLVWSIYCNTINKGGETYFPQQDTSIYPEQGTIAIWPAAWTHSHYGKPAPKEYKYIVTGWANYLEPSNK